MSRLILTVDKAGRLRLHGEDGPVQVRPISCFPWSSPGEYVSLRDADDREVALIRETQSLDTASRAALEQTIAQTSFVFVVNRIDSVGDELELRVWKVHTDQGPRTFQTKLDQWPQVIDCEAMVVRDLAGDLYKIKPHSLDPKSLKLFWAFRE
jgi:Domain of unknown function (DUF1854)